MADDPIVLGAAPTVDERPSNPDEPAVEGSARPVTIGAEAPAEEPGPVEEAPDLIAAMRKALEGKAALADFDRLMADEEFAKEMAEKAKEVGELAKGLGDKGAQMVADAAEQDKGTSSKDIKDKLAEINQEVFAELADKYPQVVKIDGGQVSFDIDKDTSPEARKAIRQALKEVKEELREARQGRGEEAAVTIGAPGLGEGERPGRGARESEGEEARPEGNAQVTDEQFRGAVEAIELAKRQGVTTAEAETLKEKAQIVEQYLEAKQAARELPPGGAGEKMLEGAKEILNDEGNLSKKDEAFAAIADNARAFEVESRNATLDKATKAIEAKLVAGDGLSANDMKSGVTEQAATIVKTLEEKEKKEPLTGKETDMITAARQLSAQDVDVNSVDGSARALVESNKARPAEAATSARAEAVSTVVTLASGSPMIGGVAGIISGSPIAAAIIEKAPAVIKEVAGREALQVEHASAGDRAPTPGGPGATEVAAAPGR